MAWYAVSYDLRKEFTPAAWARLGEALRSAVDWCKPLYSFWIVETALSPSAVISALVATGALDDNDGIVVLEITGRGNYRRVVDTDAAAWLDTRLTLA